MRTPEEPRPESVGNNPKDPYMDCFDVYRRFSSEEPLFERGDHSAVKLHRRLPRNRSEVVDAVHTFGRDWRTSYVFLDEASEGVRQWGNFVNMLRFSTGRSVDGQTTKNRGGSGWQTYYKFPAPGISTFVREREPSTGQKTTHEIIHGRHTGIVSGVYTTQTEGDSDNPQTTHYYTTSVDDGVTVTMLDHALKPDYSDIKSIRPLQTVKFDEETGKKTIETKFTYVSTLSGEKPATVQVTRYDQSGAVIERLMAVNRFDGEGNPMTLKKSTRRYINGRLAESNDEITEKVVVGEREVTSSKRDEIVLSRAGKVVASATFRYESVGTCDDNVASSVNFLAIERAGAKNVVDVGVVSANQGNDGTISIEIRSDSGVHRSCVIKNAPDSVRGMTDGGHSILTIFDHVANQTYIYKRIGVGTSNFSISTFDFLRPLESGFIDEDGREWRQI